MTIPSDRYYADTHEWVLLKDEILYVGITDYAQEQLGDLVFVGDFKTGQQVAAGDTVCVVESVKAASDIYAPVAGEVLEANDNVSNDPELIQKEPYEAWLFKLRPNQLEDVDTLLSSKQYAETL
ncbi:MAG TPA: glycine cleavage system protein GcvH [Paenalcaligenes sp.]|nr:glycine cleavage system protein GcvH [Paenalcaligenes sp.]HLR82141.1 glycine cleavage system protein GcvH [Paenalcaligenes sp.]